MSIFKAPFPGWSDQRLTDLFTKAGQGGIQQGSEDDQFSAADFTKAALTKDYLHGLQTEKQTFGGDLVEDEDSGPTKMGFSVRSNQTGVGQEGWRDAVDQQKSSIKDFYGGLGSTSGKHELGLGQTLSGKMGYKTFGDYVDQAAKAVQEGHGQGQQQQQMQQPQYTWDWSQPHDRHPGYQSWAQQYTDARNQWTRVGPGTGENNWGVGVHQPATFYNPQTKEIWVGPEGSAPEGEGWIEGYPDLLEGWSDPNYDHWKRGIQLTNNIETIATYLRPEWQDRQQQLLEMRPELDVNGNGILDREDLLAFEEQRQALGVPQGYDFTQLGQPDHYVNRIEEINAHINEHGAGAVTPPTYAVGGGYAEPGNIHLDVNNDGYITAADSLALVNIQNQGKVWGGSIPRFPWGPRSQPSRQYHFLPDGRIEITEKHLSGRESSNVYNLQELINFNQQLIEDANSSGVDPYYMANHINPVTGVYDGPFASIIHQMTQAQMQPQAQQPQAQQTQGSYLNYLWGTEPYSGYDSQWGTTPAPGANVNDPSSVLIGPYENFEGTFQDFVQNQYPGLAAAMIPTEMEQYFGGKYGSNVRELEFGQGALGYQAGTDPNLNRVLFATLPNAPEFENLMVGQVGNQIREYATHMANAFRSEEMSGIFNDQRKFGLTDANIQELQNLDPTQAGLSMTRRDADTLMTYIKSIESIYGQDYWASKDAGQLMYDMSPRLTASYALKNPVQWSFLQLKEGGDPNNMDDWVPRTLQTSVINIPLTDMQRSIMDRVTANPQDLQVFIDWFKDIYGQGDPTVGSAMPEQLPTSNNPYQNWSEWQHPEQDAGLPEGVQQDIVGYQNPQDQQYYQGPSYYAPTSQVYSDAGWQAGLPQDFQRPDPMFPQETASDIYGLTTQFRPGETQIEDVIDQGQTDPIQDAIADQTESGDQVFPDEVVEQIVNGQANVDEINIGGDAAVDPVTGALTGSDQSGVVDQSPAGQDEQGEQAEVGTPDSNYNSTTFKKTVITGGVNPDGTRNSDPFTYEHKDIKAYQVATAANGTPIWVTEDGVIYKSNDDGTLSVSISRKGMDKAFDESGRYIGPVIDPQTGRPYGEILTKSHYEMGAADGSSRNDHEKRRYELLGWWNGYEVRHANGKIVYHDGQRWKQIHRHRIDDPNEWYIWASAMGIQGYSNWQPYEYRQNFQWRDLNEVYKRTSLHPHGPSGEWNLELMGLYRGSEIRRDQNGKFYRNNGHHGWGAHSWWQEIDFNQAGNKQLEAILNNRSWADVGQYNFGPQRKEDQWMVWMSADNLRKNKQEEASAKTGQSLDFYSNHARENNFFGSNQQSSQVGANVSGFVANPGSSAESQIRQFAAGSDQATTQPVAGADQAGNQYRAAEIDYQDPWRDQGEGLGPITQEQLDWYESNQAMLGGPTPPGGHISAYDITADNWRHLPGKLRELAQGHIHLMIDQYNDNVAELDRLASQYNLSWEQVYPIRDRLYKELVDTYRGGFRAWQNYSGGNQGMDTKIYGNPNAYDFTVHEPSSNMPEDWMAKIIKGQATASSEWIQQQIKIDISSGEAQRNFIQMAINNESNPEKRHRLKESLKRVKGTGAWYAKMLKDHGINVGNMHDKVWRDAKMPMTKAKDAARMSNEQLSKRAVRNLFQYRVNEAGIGMGSRTALNHPHLLHDWDPGESFKVPMGLQVQSALGLYNDQSQGKGGWLESALSELGVNRNNIIMVSGAVKEGSRRINRVFSIQIGSQAHNMLRNGWSIQQIVDMTGGNPYTKYKGVNVSQRYFGDR